MRYATLLPLLCLCAPAGLAQFSKTGLRRAADEPRLLSAPMVGYSVQQSPLEVRAILGVPGATHYSDPFALPAAADSVRIAPHHRWLLVVRSDGAAVAWKPETGQAAELVGVTSLPDLMAFGNSGSDAIFYWKAARRMAVYRGLPDAPALAGEANDVDWPSDLRKLALSEGGQLAAGFTKRGQVLLLAVNGEAVRRLLFEDAPVAALAFRGATRSLLSLVNGGVSLSIVDEPLQGGAPRQLVELPAPVKAGAQIDASDERYVAVADHASARLMRVDTITGASRIVDIEGSAEMQSLRNRGGLLLQGGVGSAARIFTGGETQDELAYVPALVQQPGPVGEQPEVER